MNVELCSERPVVGASDVVVGADQGVVGERDERAETQRVQDEDTHESEGRRDKRVANASLTARSRRRPGGAVASRLGAKRSETDGARVVEAKCSHRTPPFELKARLAP